MAPKKGTTPSRAAPMEEVPIQKRTDLPTPVTDGPVEPPKAPTSWWVLVVMMLFVFGTAALVVFVVLTKPFAPEPPPVVVVPTTESALKVLSYLSVVDPVQASDHYLGTPDECWSENGETEWTAPNPEAPPRTAEAPLHLLLDVQVRSQDRWYQDEVAFLKDLERLNRLVDLANEHKLKLTIHVQAPFTTIAAEKEISDLARWAEEGHVLAMGFNEADLVASKERTDTTPYGQWLSKMHDDQAALESLCGCEVTSWSGRNLYERMYDVGEELGLVANHAWLYTDENALLSVVNPWTPDLVGSVSAMKTFDPLGQVVFIPDGVYPEHCRARLGDAAPSFTDAGFTYTTKALYESFEESVKGRVNVFSATVDFAVFDRSENDDEAFAAWEVWLDEIVDPLVVRRLLIPSTYAEVAVAYQEWLENASGTITPVYLSEEEATELY